MNFKRYQHIERLGTSDVEGILDGIVYIFPKLDGANAQMWRENGKLCCGTRNQQLQYGNNSGWDRFWDYVHQHEGIKVFFAEHPTCRLYGEWLIPHTLRTYVSDAWNKFYVFDVTYQPYHVNEFGITIIDSEELKYINYDQYKPLMEQYGIEYIPCWATAENATPEILDKVLEHNTYLIQEGKGVGEGIVIKRYDFLNKYGRTTWAKRVTNEFKFGHFKEMGAPTLKGGMVIEDVIVREYITFDVVEKEYAKICAENCPSEFQYSSTDGWNSKYIPRLLGTVYHTLITEELWHALKKYKAHQVIDFRVLNQFTIKKIKELKPELF